MSEQPYFTGNISKSGAILMVTIPSKRRKEFPKDSVVRVELIKRGDEEEVNILGDIKSNGGKKNGSVR